MKIDKLVIIGTGSLILRDIEDNVKAFGVPAKKRINKFGKNYE